MRTVNIRDAKTHLSRLVEQAAAGESFIIAKAGRPMVKVVAIDAPDPGTERRFGFLVGHGSIPDDFNSLSAEEIAGMFE